MGGEGVESVRHPCDSVELVLVATRGCVKVAGCMRVAWIRLSWVIPDYEGEYCNYGLISVSAAPIG